jgi:hypothetical protein
VLDLDPYRLTDGTLAAYTSLGGYPLIYVTRDGEIVCAEHAETTDDSDPVVAVDVHWEGEPYACVDCGKQIESAYGDPDEGTGTDDN